MGILGCHLLKCPNLFLEAVCVAVLTFKVLFAYCFAKADCLQPGEGRLLDSLTLTNLSFGAEQDDTQILNLYQIVLSLLCGISLD